MRIAFAILAIGTFTLHYLSYREITKQRKVNSVMAFYITNFTKQVSERAIAEDKAWKGVQELNIKVHRFMSAQENANTEMEGLLDVLRSYRTEAPNDSELPSVAF